MSTETILHINVTNLAYIAASVLFILGLKRLGSPATARNGNRLSSIAMLVSFFVVKTDVLGNTLEALLASAPRNTTMLKKMTIYALSDLLKGI